MRGLLLAGALVLAWAAPAHAADAGFTLHRGVPVFWDGKAASAEYDLDVVDQGFRLRVGIDHHTVGDVWTVELIDPAGSVERTISPGTGLYSAEAIVEDPARGRWRAVVRGEGVADPRFRMRALLERSPAAPPATPEPVLPNLQAMPPWDFKFLFPVSNGGMPVPSTGLPTAGRAGCHPEEIAEHQPLRCLRMAFGVSNTGQGPMQLHFEGNTSTFADRELLQRVVWTDGSTTERVAGRAVYHKTHQHYHHDSAVGLQLFRVVADGRLEPVGDEHRKGFAHRDELLRDWRRFYPQHKDFGFGLAAGWADYYEWDRPGNYIDFGLNADGRYLIRLTADPVGGVLEANELDNTGYTMFDVAGDQVTWLASGRGLDPWDRCAIPLPNGPEPEPAAPLRPADCPPDTTWLPEPPAGVAPAPRSKAVKKPGVSEKKAAKRKPRCKTRKQKRSKRCRAKRRGKR